MLQQCNKCGVLLNFATFLVKKAASGVSQLPNAAYVWNYAALISTALSYSRKYLSGHFQNRNFS